jgi:hypothetical protein
LRQLSGDRTVSPVATDPLYIVSAAACAGLACLFVISSVVLTLVLVRRSRKRPGGVA